MTGNHHNGVDIQTDHSIDCDVCIIGSGAGGSVLAARLTEAGLKAVMLEEGGRYFKEDFDLQEATAYPMLYQDRGARTTADLAFKVMQGRSVGGGTTVNWTFCFRTPERILNLWGSRHGAETLAPAELRPHIEAVEKRLNINPWLE